MKQSLQGFIALLLLPVMTLHAAEPASSIHESFDAPFDAKRFLTPIPNKNTEVRDGVLWTRGSSGGKYPPMVYLPVQGKDLTISFRYRHLGAGGMIWFFVDGDDGFGSEDHMLRVKLLRDGVQLQIDAHSKDANHPMRQNNERPADKKSGAYRLNEILPLEKVDLTANAWQRWVKARARIEGQTVVVWPDEAKQPIAVRYAWVDHPACNLHNHTGLPAFPFSTENSPPPATASQNPGCCMSTSPPKAVRL